MRLLSCVLLALSSVCAAEPIQHEFSTAGFFAIEDAGREVYNFNIGWRFHKGSVDGADAVSFDDSNWPVVNAPHGLEVLPDDASGSINYQGAAWYRKHFTVPASMKNRRVVLHFEGINTPLAGEIAFESIPAVNGMLFNEVGTIGQPMATLGGRERTQTSKMSLDAVGALQTEFEHH